jgi:hypothetical protein
MSQDRLASSKSIRMTFLYKNHTKPSPKKAFHCSSPATADLRALPACASGRAAFRTIARSRFLVPLTDKKARSGLRSCHRLALRLRSFAQRKAVTAHGSR